MLLAIVPDISMKVITYSHKSTIFIKIIKYFKVQQPTIIWTTTTYMVVYCCTIWVASWATESRGLRTVAIFASGVCAMGAGIKVRFFNFHANLTDLKGHCDIFASILAI